MKKIVAVSFNAHAENTDDLNTGKDYCYFTDLDLAVGDKCVVCVHHSSELKVVTVVQTEGIADYNAKKATQWIVSLIDMNDYKERMKKEMKIQELRNQLRSRKEEMEEMLMLKTLAAEDEGIKKLLMELGDLDPTLVPKSLLVKPE